MSTGASDQPRGTTEKEDGMLEKVARVIDPPGREVSDAEIMDPGANIPNPGESELREEEQRAKRDTPSTHR